MKLLSCPICGRKPKLKIEYYPTGAVVRIKCKPFFRKVHLEVVDGKALPDKAVRNAINCWNEKAVIKR